MLAAGDGDSHVSASSAPSMIRAAIAYDRRALTRMVELGRYACSSAPWWTRRSTSRRCAPGVVESRERVVRDRELVVAGASTGRGRGMVGAAWSPRGRRRCCRTGAASARRWMRLLEAVRGGQSRVLVVCGEPGVGKTALLQSAIGSASGFRVMRAVGVESEMELAFAAAAAVVRADAGSAGPAPCPSAGRARAWRSGCARGTRRIGFWWGWRC